MSPLGIIYVETALGASEILSEAIPSSGLVPRFEDTKRRLDLLLRDIDPNLKLSDEQYNTPYFRINT